jgi:hypothetical protein
MGMSSDLINAVSERLNDESSALVDSLELSDGYYICDNFLGPEILHKLRSEAVSLFNSGQFSVSKSTRYDPVSEAVVEYDKVGVFSMQLMGGEQYHECPGMCLLPPLILI